MGVNIKRTLTVKDREGRTVIVNQDNIETANLVVVKDKATGEEFLIDGREETQTELETTVICDGPKCDDGHGHPTHYSWTQESAKEDPYALPDGMYRVLTLGIGVANKEPKVFCSYDCLRTFMRDYVPPRSPRELKEEADNNMRVILEQRAKEMREEK